MLEKIRPAIERQYIVYIYVFYFAAINYLFMWKLGCETIRDRVCSLCIINSGLIYIFHVIENHRQCIFPISPIFVVFGFNIFMEWVETVVFNARVYSLLMNWSPSTAKRTAITLLGSGWEYTDLDTAVRRGSVAHHELVFMNHGCDPCDGSYEPHFMVPYTRGAHHSLCVAPCKRSLRLLLMHRFTSFSWLLGSCIRQIQTPPPPLLSDSEENDDWLTD